MGLFDGYFDPQQFQHSGGLLGRLLSLQPQDQYQPGQGFGQSSGGGTIGVPEDAYAQGQPSAPQAPVLQPMPWPNLPNNGHTPPAPQPPAQDLHSQYQALRPILGDHAAMLATVHPEVGQTLIAQAQTGRQPDNIGNVVQAGYRLGGIPFPPTEPVPLPPIPVPAIPDWWKAAAKVLQLYPRTFSGKGGGGDDRDECDEQLEAEMSRCYGREQEYAHPDFLHGCKERAKDRRGLCVKNGRRFPPSEPPEWGLDDEEIRRNLDR